MADHGLRLVVFALFLFFPGTGCGSKSAHESESRLPVDLAHDRMVSALRVIAEQADERNPYLGTAEIRNLERQLQLANAQQSTPFEELISIRTALAFHRLRVGATSESVDDLTETYRLWKEQPEKVPTAMSETLLFMLAVAHLRLAENENCVACTNGESCIFPLRGEALHSRPESTRKARELLEELLSRKPTDLAARWLLTLCEMALDTSPDQLSVNHIATAAHPLSTGRFPEFINRAAELRLNTMSLSGGMIVDDFDGDDLLDVICSDCHPTGQLRFYSNNGDGTFTEKTDDSGLTGITGGLNLLHADFNNDGSLDVFVTRGAWLGEVGMQPNSLLKNDGQGHFRDVTFAAGLAEPAFPSQTAAWADADLDGDLDLFVGNEQMPCQLFINNGDETFRDVASLAGVQNGLFTKGVVWGDYDSDGDPDLYVSNLNGPNRLYQNQGGNRFRDVAEQLGVDGPEKSFPVFCWDINNDGHLDLSVFSYSADIADLAAESLGLAVTAPPDAHYLNDGEGGFRNSTVELNLNRVTHPMGANFGDIDNDGFLDFYLGTGDIPFQMLMPNLAFRNRKGESFEDITATSRLGHLQKGHGISFADLDGDGDQDVAIELGGAFPGDQFQNAVFENTIAELERGHWIALKLEGTTSNRSAIGTRIRAIIAEDGKERSVYRWVTSGGSFGCNPLRVHIGIGRATEVKSLEVQWPASGKQQQVAHVAAGQFYRLREDSDSLETIPWRATPFADRPTTD